MEQPCGPFAPGLSARGPAATALRVTQTGERLQQRPGRSAGKQAHWHQSKLISYTQCGLCWRAGWCSNAPSWPVEDL